MERSGLSKILIITYPDISLGFRLSGIEIKEVEEGEDITSILRTIVTKGEYGLLAVEEVLLSKVPDEILRMVRKIGIPVIVPINTPRSWHGEAEVESYIARVIRRAIGYQVKIKR